MFWNNSRSAVPVIHGANFKFGELNVHRCLNQACLLATLQNVELLGPQYLTPSLFVELCNRHGGHPRILISLENRLRQKPLQSFSRHGVLSFMWLSGLFCPRVN